MPVPASHKTHNVASELKNPGSILNFYKRLLFLRHHERALLDGAYVPLNESDPYVLSYLRRYQGEVILVALNMSATTQSIGWDLTPQGFSSPKTTTLLADQSVPPPQGWLKQVLLEPFSVYIAKISEAHPAGPNGSPLPVVMSESYRAKR